MILCRRIALTVHEDRRGALWEALRRDQLDEKGFGQIYVVIAHPGESRGNHLHHHKSETFVVVKGEALVELWCDDAAGSAEREACRLDGETPEALTVPPEVYHRITNCGQGELILVVHSDELFDPGDPDTISPPVTGR